MEEGVWRGGLTDGRWEQGEKDVRFDHIPFRQPAMLQGHRGGRGRRENHRVGGYTGVDVPGMALQGELRENKETQGDLEAKKGRKSVFLDRILISWRHIIVVASRALRATPNSRVWIVGPSA